MEHGEDKIDEGYFIPLIVSLSPFHVSKGTITCEISTNFEEKMLRLFFIPTATKFPSTLLPTAYKSTTSAIEVTNA